MTRTKSVHLRNSTCQSREYVLRSPSKHTIQVVTLDGGKVRQLAHFLRLRKWPILIYVRVRVNFNLIERERERESESKEGW